jgi:hypothetical protein
MQRKKRSETSEKRKYDCSLSLRRRCNCWSTTMLLYGESAKVSLAILQCSRLSASSTLPIHAEPKHRDKETTHTGRDVLRDLPSLLPTQFLNPVIVALDLGKDRRAIQVLILGLNSRHGLRSPAHTRT